jgi:hypothetical protein
MAFPKSIDFYEIIDPDTGAGAVSKVNPLPGPPLPERGRELEKSVFYPL